MHARIWRYFQRSRLKAAVTQAALNSCPSCANPTSLGISASLRSMQVLQITGIDYDITPPQFEVHLQMTTGFASQARSGHILLHIHCYETVREMRC
jgi:hypothetical protein